MDISQKSSPAMSYSLPTPTNTTPATPDHSLPEVSAFSPDTPLEIPDGGHTTHKAVHNSKSAEDDRQSSQATLSSSTPGRANEVAICNSAGTASSPEIQQKLDPPPKVLPSPDPQASPGTSSTKSDKGELEKWWDHEWTIDQLESSVKDFPQNMLRLTSPVVMFLRNNHERALLRPFRQVFPNAPQSLLDSLCAVLIAKNYLLSLPSLGRRNINTAQRVQTSRLDTVPEQTTSMLGMKFAQPASSQVRDQVLGSRTNKLHEDLDHIVDNLLFTIQGPSGAALRSATLVLIQVLETKT